MPPIRYRLAPTGVDLIHALAEGSGGEFRDLTLHNLTLHDRTLRSVSTVGAAVGELNSAKSPVSEPT